MPLAPASWARNKSSFQAIRLARSILAAEQEGTLVGEVGDDGVGLGGKTRANDGVGGQRAAVLCHAPALEGATSRGHHEGGILFQRVEKRLFGLLALLVGLEGLLALLRRSVREIRSEVLIQLVALFQRLF